MALFQQGVNVVNQPMLGICSDSNDPFFNLAVEDYLLHERKEDFLLLNINDPCVVVGKHQVVHREVNTRFIEEKRIPVIRRITGGGTVYHDRGNLNFTFIRQSKAGHQVDFRFYTRPVIDFLASVGVDAVFGSRNDLTIDGLKFSGNAEHVFRERVLHHGTLLFDSSLDDLRQSVRIKTDNYSTRAVESNRTSVTNLKGKLDNIFSIDVLTGSLFNYLLETMSDTGVFGLTDNELDTIKSLAEFKYKTWEWNYGYGPPYTFSNWFVMNEKVHRFRIFVRDGIIWECDIEGNEEIIATGKKLIGCRHMYEDLLEKFKSENIPVTEDEIFKFF
jgi:lipoate-protein ligase A